VVRVLAVLVLAVLVLAVRVLVVLALVVLALVVRVLAVLVGRGLRALGWDWAPAREEAAHLVLDSLLEESQAAADVFAALSQQGQVLGLQQQCSEAGAQWVPRRRWRRSGSLIGRRS